MYQHILIPIDDSPLSTLMVFKALRFATKIEARVTFLHAHPDASNTEEGSLMLAMAPATFQNMADGNSWALLGKAASSARGAGVPFEVVSATSDRPADTILETAKERQCDLIFMASHGRRSLKDIFSGGSVTQKVLQKTEIPVLVSSIESNAPLTEEQKAALIILDEHRSISTSVNSIRYLLESYKISGAPADYALMGKLLHYLGEFSDKLHHPKESECLFAKLRARTNDCNEVLAQLDQQHEEFLPLMARLRDTLDAAEKQANVDIFAAAFNEYTEALWRHMGIEERVLLPAASKHFTPADWAHIAQVFEQNNEATEDGHNAASLKELFERLVTQTAQQGRRLRGEC